MATKVYSVYRHVRMRPYEAELLASKAKKLNISQSEYMRMMIRENPKDYPELRRLIKELVGEINHVGVNINQIVHNYNMELYSRRDKEELVAYLEKIHKAFRELMVKLGNKQDNYN